MVRPAALVTLLTCAAALAQQPRIDSVSPAQGPIAGGTVVTIKGASLGFTVVQIGTAPVTPLSQRDDEIRLQMPRHDNGYAVIAARNQTGSAYGEFLYVPPRLDELPPGWITTVAGVGTYARDFGPAVNATISPAGLAYDKFGNLYIAENLYNKVSRVHPDGTIERVTGINGIVPGNGLPAVEASVGFPLAVAVDPAGNLYIPDHYNYIRKVDATTGIISTIAGDGTNGFSGDGGPAINAKIGLPTHIAADGDDLFFIDFDANRIRRIHFADGTISTFAGNGVAGFSGDGGAATAASFNVGDSDRGHLALDPAGNLYLADSLNFRIRRIDRRAGIITTFYVLPPEGSNAPDAVNGIRSLTFDSAGNAYYGGSGRIVKLDSSGHFVRSWGNGSYALPVEGASALTTGLGHVTGLAIDGNGNIVFSDDAIGRVRRIEVANDTLHTVAGIGPATIGENGPPAAAVLDPNDLAFDPQGRLLIAETLRLRRLEPDGNLVTIGGSGSFIGTFPPAPMKNVVIAPTSIEIDRDGNIDMADLSVVDRIDTSGTLRWIAGQGGVCGLAGDGGPAAQATLCQAWDTTRDRDGNLLIADTNNNRIRRVDAKTGIITTIAGNGGPVNGYEGYNHGRSCGDGGKAIDACLNTPYGIEFDDVGNLYISEGGTIRKVDPSGTISTFAFGFTSKMLFSRGYLYAKMNGVWRHDRAGVRTLIAGRAGDPIGNDVPIEDGGPALAANIPPAGQANGIAIDAEGNLFFVASSRVRAVRYGAVLAPAGATISATANGANISVSVRDMSGQLAPSVRVDFSAPPTGATCTLSSAFAITDANGVASVTCRPNCIAGTYSVTARPLTAASTATVSLTNSGGGVCKPRAARK